MKEYKYGIEVMNQSLHTLATILNDEEFESESAKLSTLNRSFTDTCRYFEMFACLMSNMINERMQAQDNDKQKKDYDDFPDIIPYDDIG